MRLKEVVRGLGIDDQLGEYAGADVADVGCDSRLAIPGGLFVAVSGAVQDGKRFIDEAVAKGVKFVVSEGAESGGVSGICSLKVDDSRRAVALIAANFYGHPASRMQIIGVTGTDGKTTVTYLTERILSSAGFSVGVIGTIEYRYAGKRVDSINTTPGPVELQKMFSDMVACGVDYVVMEVSSHSLHQSRVAGIPFKYAVLTNFTSDHLDYHKTLEEYFLAKASLFKGLDAPSFAVINRDSGRADDFISFSAAHVCAYGLDAHGLDMSASDISLGSYGSEFTLNFRGQKEAIRTSLVGRHNVYNIMAASAVCMLEGVSAAAVRDGIAGVSGVCGRLEPVKCGQPFEVFVDYAHTQNALANVLSSLRSLSPKRILTVFGCGGMRDKSKRPAMGRVATELSDLCFITSDNPRQEPLEGIFKDILEGIERSNYRVIADRKQAIYEALRCAGSGDIVLIAGKGHERFQIFADGSKEFDDRKAVQDFFKGENV